MRDLRLDALEADNPGGGGGGGGFGDDGDDDAYDIESDIEGAVPSKARKAEPKRTAASSVSKAVCVPCPPACLPRVRRW